MGRNAGRPKGTSGKAPVLTTAEISRVIKLAATDPRFGLRNSTILSLSFWLGLRAKEVAALQIGDVLDANGSIKSVIHLKATYTKGSRTRDVFPSAPKLLVQIAKHLNHLSLENVSEPLFPTRTGKHFSSNGMVQLFRKLLTDAGIEKGSSHCGRRTMITGLAERGIDLKSLSVIAGHRNVSTTALYVETNPSRLSRIMEAVDY